MCVISVTSLPCQFLEPVRLYRFERLCEGVRPCAIWGTLQPHATYVLLSVRVNGPDFKVAFNQIAVTVFEHLLEVTSGHVMILEGHHQFAPERGRPETSINEACPI